MKKIWIFFIPLLFMGALKYIPADRGSFALLNTTYANSQVDTVFYQRPSGLNALAFSACTKDSASFTDIIVRRMIDGELQLVLAGDTLTPFNAKVDTLAGLKGTAANPSQSVTGAVSLAPLADTYVFIVTYAAAKNGVTNPKVSYLIQQTFNW